MPETRRYRLIPTTIEAMHVTERGPVEFCGVKVDPSADVHESVEVDIYLTMEGDTIMQHRGASFRRKWKLDE